MDYINTRYYMVNPTKSILNKKGFRYDLECSTKDCDCFAYSFPVDYYNKTPILFCKLRVYMDNGEVTIDVYDKTGNIYPAWYQKGNRIYFTHKNYITKLDNIIRKELIKLCIETKENSINDRKNEIKY